MIPLADRIRPQSLAEVFGQEHILGEGKPINNMVKMGNAPNMIFYGPSGTGKTTVANIVAKSLNKPLNRLNATTASSGDIKEIIAGLDTLAGINGCILYLDEIQHFNKKQQQLLLEFIENGKITLIASTTENPYFSIYNAVLSRCLIFEFKQLETHHVVKALSRASEIIRKQGGNLTIDPQAAKYIANIAFGDVRRAINYLEALYLYSKPTKDGVITIDMCEQMISIKAFRHDKGGDSHYDILSAFQKSIRGSDVNASIYYLGRLVTAGDLQSICRRLLVIAAEDISLASPNAICVVKSCCDAAKELGFPEARIPLAQATALLALSPKSNSVICAIDNAMNDISSRDTGEVPDHLKDSNYKNAPYGKGYKYPHSYPNNYVKQQYLPKGAQGAKYYSPGKNKIEQAFENYWKNIYGEVLE